MTFLHYSVQSRIANERIQQPVVVNGETFVGTAEAARRYGCNPDWLLKLVRGTPGENVVLTTPRGIRFIRLPRGKDDRRAPVYFDPESLK